MDVIDRCIEGRKTICVYLAFQADSTLLHSCRLNAHLDELVTPPNHDRDRLYYSHRVLESGLRLPTR